MAAIQYDELELKMQERIGTMITELKEAKNSRHLLRTEVFTLKQRLANNDSEEVHLVSIVYIHQYFRFSF